MTSTSGRPATSEDGSLSDSVHLIQVPTFDDARGRLAPFEFNQLPFVPLRMFVVRDVPVGTTRGGHAHRSQRHLLICLAGKVVVDVRVEGDHRSFVLDQPQTGLLMESGVWSSQTFAADGSILVGLASAPYDRNDYQTEESQAS